MIDAVYTMQNGKPVRVLKAGREIEITSAPTAESTTKALMARHIRRGAFDIKNGRIVVREGVQTADKMDANGEYLEVGVYLRMTESHKLYDGEEISRNRPMPIWRDIKICCSMTTAVSSPSRNTRKNNASMEINSGNESSGACGQKESTDSCVKNRTGGKRT